MDSFHIFIPHGSCTQAQHDECMDVYEYKNDDYGMLDYFSLMDSSSVLDWIYQSFLVNV
jgi:hypothetical protein